MQIAYPRVVSLSYRIDSDDTHDYARNAELDGELEGFRFRLRHRNADFETLRWFPSMEEARSCLDPQLHVWELHTDLHHGTGTLRFKFVSAHVQQCAPRPGVIEVSGAALSFTGQRIQITITFNNHPGPPRGFAVNECVQTLGDLFLLARSNPLTVLYVAYSMTTCVELYFKDLATAANRLGFSKNVFDEINKLANTRGKGAEVRKFKERIARQPLSEAERNWLMLAMENIVRRAGADAAGAPVGEQITLETMPITR